jgi:hypothetical protein
MRGGRQRKTDEGQRLYGLHCTERKLKVTLVGGVHVFAMVDATTKEYAESNSKL